MSYSFTPEGLENIDETKPDGAVEAGAVVDDALRQIKKACKEFANKEHALGGLHLRFYAADTGSANAYAVSLPHKVTAYANGLSMDFKALNANTGASTLNPTFNSIALGAKSIKVGTAALSANQIKANQVYRVTYDGTDFQLLNPTLTAKFQGIDRTDVTNVISITGVTPEDDTIPLNNDTEGTQVASLTITPDDAAQKLVITFIGHVYSPPDARVAAFLCRDSDVNAIAAAMFKVQTETGLLVVKREIVAGSTNATTFKARVGRSSASAGTPTLNKTTNDKSLGGVITSSLEVMRYNA